MTKTSPESTPFAELIAAARDADARARYEVIERVYPRVERLVHARMQSQFRAKNPWIRPIFSTGDVVQDVFIGLLGTDNKLDGQGDDAVVRYLATAVHNRLLDMVRHHGAARRDARRRAGTDEDGSAPDKVVTRGKSPWRDAAAKEKLETYLEVLESFPRNHQIALRQRLEHDLSFAALAEMLDLPSADAARKLFHYAHAKLLMRLNTRGISPDTHETRDA